MINIALPRKSKRNNTVASNTQANHMVCICLFLVISAALPKFSFAMSVTDNPPTLDN
jgi:hypothetical protein